ncbi:Glycosyltransferase involved in cell wall bisynthesis [Colwellia chukchiensis]|uniref:Glycosyltransferase involved in cell wall bisynthesis n=1 Tax=Colwellia chukchiensis TaxID=641665 RepID=A0A1H7PTH9_9GAMM|nr:glycosyltransferase family 4 protein [Colwellia chukchiensis]SEL39130.1 Glycosyltransferase involved in cell wall bisynthesis [Colwellia chukchiensis]
MKILIIGAYPNSIIGFRGNLIRHFIAAGHQVTVMSAPASADVIAQLHALGASFRPYRVARNGLNPFIDLQTLLDIKRAYHAIAPDKVLAYTIKPIIWGGIAAHITRFDNFNAMITGLGYAFEKGNWLRNSVSLIVKCLYKFSLLKAQNVIFQNQDNRQCFIDLGLARAEQCYRVFGSGIDTQEFKQQPLPTGEVTFLLIARLLGDKGIREYAQAARIVKQTYPQAKFQLVGPYDSSPDKISAAEVAQWQAGGQLDYLGAVDDVKPYLAACHIYTLPSYHEGLPRTVLEAMSIGRAILTTDTVGCRDTVVAGANGYLVPVRDVDALVQRMLWFIEHPERWPQMANSSRRMAEGQFNVAEVNAQIAKILAL